MFKRRREEQDREVYLILARFGWMTEMQVMVMSSMNSVRRPLNRLLLRGAVIYEVERDYDTGEPIFMYCLAYPGKTR